MGCGLRSSILCFSVLSLLWGVFSEDDSQCLKDFKASVHDPNNHLYNWNFGNASQGYVCSFVGVSCWNGQENKVMGLKLQDSGLSGNFPSGLTQCKALQTLDLSQNSFTGAIPSDLCKQVPYITGLDLSQNSFSESIPFTLEDCQYLQTLKLEHNQLSGELPGGIGVLPKLTALDVSSNMLTGQIPSSFTNKSIEKFPASSFSDNPGLCGPPLSKSCSSKSNLGLKVAIAVAIAAVAVVCAAFAVWYWLLRSSRKKYPLLKDEHSWAKNIKARRSVVVSLFEEPLVKLRLSDLMAATNNFSKESIIGEGPTGTVYKAALPDGSMLAVKRLWPTSRSEKDFQTEMDTLGKVRHKNLVPLLGFCAVGSEKLLVYKHIVNGSLREHLHGPLKESRLDWIARVQIAIGAARGLAWLHHSCNPRIIHCNISSTTILLDEELLPRITDFGLARLVNPANSYISTFVIGTFGEVGYVAPEYSQTMVATVKGDVFSFGVVLLELVTGQKANDVCTDDGFKGSLSEWISFLASNGRLEESIHNSFKGGLYDNELKQFLRVSHACVMRNPKERPTMYEVYQLLRAIGEKYNLTDDEYTMCADVINVDEIDEVNVAKEN